MQSAIIIFAFALALAPRSPHAATLLLDPNSPPATVVYLVTADDGFSQGVRSILVESASASARVDTIGVVNPVGDLKELVFVYPETRVEATIGTADLPFVLTITRFVERLAHPSASAFIARFPLGDDATVNQTVDGGYTRTGFSLSLESGGTILHSVGNVDCLASNCIGGTATAMVVAGIIEELRFRAGGQTALDPTLSLGTDGLGIAWSVEITSRWPIESAGEMVLVPEPTTLGLTVPGLVALVLVQRRMRQLRVLDSARKPEDYRGGVRSALL